MDSLNVVLPESVRDYVRDRVAEGGYGSVGEYVRDLILADQRRKAEERVDALLLDGLDSGGAIDVDPSYWEDRKGSLVARFGKATEGS